MTTEPDEPVDAHFALGTPSGRAPAIVGALALGLIWVAAGIALRLGFDPGEWPTELASMVGRDRWSEMLPVVILLVAPLLCLSRSPLRVGLGLGAALHELPRGLLFLLFADGGFPAIVMLAAVAIATGVAVRSLRHSSDPLARKIAFTAAMTTAVVLGELTVIFWWPEAWSAGGDLFRTVPMPHVVVSAMLFIVGLWDLHQRRSRALVSLALGSVVLLLDPEHGLTGFTSGCIRMSGPTQFLVFPPAYAPIGLAPWVGLVVAFLRRPRTAGVFDAPPAPKDREP